MNWNLLPFADPKYPLIEERSRVSETGFTAGNVELRL